MNSTGKFKEESLFRNPDSRFIVVALFAALAIIVLRRPDAILNPQFWAEDGTLLYADAYNKGIIIPLISPQGGYLDTFPRLVAAFVQLFPPSWAPLLFTMSFIMIRGLVGCFILSTRFSHIMPALGLRLLLSFLYLALPNSWEVNAGLTHAKIHLALLAFMVLSAKPDSNYFWRIFDAGVLLISGLSGPFCILLAPLSAIFWLHRRDKRSLVFFILIGICAIIQGTILMIGPGRPQRLLGATPKLFIEILATQVFLGALIGQKGLELIHHLRWHNAVIIIAALLGLLALIKALLRAPLELRLFVLYALLLFVAALLFPLGKPNDPQWPLLIIPGVGGRHWFIPILAFVSVLVWSLRGAGSFISRRLAALALAVMVLGIILDWRFPAFKDLNFRGHASQFESSPRGTQVSIPINPQGWTVTLVKH